MCRRRDLVKLAQLETLHVGVFVFMEGGVPLIGNR